LPGTPAENLLMIVGPDLAELERLADRIKRLLEQVPGMENIGVFHGLGQSQVEFRIDPDKCARWGVSSHEVNMLLSTALAGKSVPEMVEGGKGLDIVRHGPRRLRESEQAILDLPLDVGYRRVLPGPGSAPNTSEPIGAMPRLRLRDVVSAVGEGDEPGRAKE